MGNWECKGGASLLNGLLESRNLRRNTMLPLMLLGALLLSTNHWFSIQEDEVLIVRGALDPLKDILGKYMFGTGMHTHPPLSEIFMHEWLAWTGGSLAWLRLMNIGFYLAGIWVLARAANLLGGPNAGPTLAWAAVLWPFGFHSGWLFGWFTFAFFVVAVLTYAYLQFLERLNFRSWLWMVLAAVALLWTNYYGWVFIACLALDFLLRHGRLTREFAFRYFGTLVLLVILFSPLIPALLAAIAKRSADNTRSLPVLIAYAIWNVYAMIASESIAPWHFAFSIPVGLAIACSLILTLRFAPEKARRLLIGFVVLVAGLTINGQIGTKRDLLIVPWLFLPVTVTLATLNGRRKQLMLGTVALAFGLGWFGIFARSYYGTLRLFEPWQEVSQSVAEELQHGAGVVAYHPIFFFHLTYDLGLTKHGTEERLDGVLPTAVKDSRVFNAVQFIESGFPARPEMIYVKAAGFIERQETAKPAEEWLETHCRLLDTHGYLPDPYSELKLRFGEDKGHLPYRIEVRKYDCGESKGP